MWGRMLIFPKATKAKKKRIKEQLKADKKAAKSQKEADQIQINLCLLYTSVSEALSGECAMWNVLSGKRSAVLLIK